MSVSTMLRLVPESGTFLLREAGDLRFVVGENPQAWPLPQRIFLDDEEATPLLGFPVMLSDRTKSLRGTLEAYVTAEERVELSVATGQPLDKRAAESAWEIYINLLGSCVANAVASSFGRGYPDIFWLYHSIAVSRVFKEIPGRIAAENSEVGRKLGSDIKYRIFNRYLDKTLRRIYDVVERAAAETEEREEEIFPYVFSRMRDNILILTEDHISPDLRELDGFFTAFLRADGRDFRHRLGRLREWHSEILTESRFRSQIKNLLELESISSGWSLLVRPGYVRFLSTLPTYETEGFFDDRQIELWSRLLQRLKEFELLTALRRYVAPVHEADGKLRAQGSAFRGAVPATTREVVLSYTTRPLDFSTPWVVDPRVRRFGLVYDITDFSSIVSLLRRSGSDAQDLSYRRILGFQRKVNRIAQSYRLKLEKYLGDGALYSGRHPALLLCASLRLQRHYRDAVRDDFPFDRGMRMALNYGSYRLLPIEGGDTGRHRYEFFGHGIVELSRLVTGKRSDALSEIKNQLLNFGYDPQEVDRFFAPVSRKHHALHDDSAMQRDFFAAITTSGSLVNEGIVATREFMVQLESDERLRVHGLSNDGPRRYVVVDVEDGEGTVRAGVRLLGRAQLKGLQSIQVFEIVDGGPWYESDFIHSPRGSLIEMLEEEFERALEA